MDKHVTCAHFTISYLVMSYGWGVFPHIEDSANGKMNFICLVYFKMEQLNGWMDEWMEWTHRWMDGATRSKDKIIFYWSLGI